MPFLDLVLYAASFFFSPPPTILPLAPFRAPNGPDGNAIPASVSAANAPPVHAVHILSRRASLRDFDPLPCHRHPHPPEPAPSVRRRPHALRSRSPVQCADRPALLPPGFQSPRARPHPTARDGTLPRASPPFTSK